MLSQVTGGGPLFLISKKTRSSLEAELGRKVRTEFLGVAVERAMDIALGGSGAFKTVVNY